MATFLPATTELQQDGFTIIPAVFYASEIQQIIHTIEAAATTSTAYKKGNELFAIRRFVQEIPGALPLIMTQPMQDIIQHFGGPHLRLVKSIYFDKPASSNWFVAWHQDLTIAVKEKHVVEGYGPWTKKDDQYAVQPPAELLRQNLTIRIHLDNTDETNGALKVVPGSHAKGITRPGNMDWSKEHIRSCSVTAGGIMIMRPMLLHASDRTTNQQRRRVIHLEFSAQHLPVPLQWAEFN